MSVCRGCNADIIWAVTAGNKSIPLDAVPNPEGNVALTGNIIDGAGGRRGPECRVIGPPGMFEDGVIRFMPHHATCPQVDDFR